MALPVRLSEATQRLRRLMDEKNYLEDRLKGVNKDLKELKERVIPKCLADAELENARVENAGTVSVQQQLYVSLVGASDEEAGDMEPPFYDWARENAPEIIKPYIHPARLKSYCKERLENGLWLPDNMVKATFVPTARLLRR